MKVRGALFGKTLAFILILMLTLTIITASQMTLAQDSKVEAPEWKNGDDWYYRLERPEGDIAFKAKITSEHATFKIDEKEYSCYMEERTWFLTNETITLKNFYQKKNLAEVGTIDANGKRHYFGEPLVRLDFPLQVGDYWEGNTLQYSQGADEDAGKPQSKVNYTFRIMEKTTVSVPAGTFEAYKINGTIIDTDPSNNGQPGGYGAYAHFYYSPKVRNYVKIANYYQQTEAGVQKLKSYNLTERNGNTNDSPFIGTLTMGATAITMVAIYSVVKKNRED